MQDMYPRVPTRADTAEFQLPCRRCSKSALRSDGTGTDTDDAKRRTRFLFRACSYSFLLQTKGKSSHRKALYKSPPPLSKTLTPPSPCKKYKTSISLSSLLSLILAKFPSVSSPSQSPPRLTLNTPLTSLATPVSRPRTPMTQLARWACPATKAARSVSSGGSWDAEAGSAEEVEWA